MKVLVAKRAGFCSGVKRAVDKLLELSAEKGPGSTLGPIVHNEEVVRYLSEHGVNVIKNPAEANGAFLAVRTHGLAPEMWGTINKLQGVEIVDLTCPRVSESQKIIGRLNDAGVLVVIAGNKKHPEVEALIGWSGGRAIVVNSPEELESAVIEAPAALVAQTTADPETFKEIRDLFLNILPEGEIFNTLCPETRLRREEISKMASRVDALVVVGSDTSANTKTLLNYCRQQKPSCRVMKAGELSEKFVKSAEVIGLTAGASTPPWTIKEVVESMENENLENESLEEKDEVTETTEEVVENEEQFDFNGELKVPQVGEQVTGIVARVTEEEVYLDIGAKSEAILPAGEIHLDEGQKPADILSPEDKIEVTVTDIDEQDGNVTVSHKRLAREKRLQEFEQSLKDEEIMQGRVKQVVGAGMVVEMGSGIEGFMPGSLVDTSYIPDFSEFVNQEIDFKIIEFDRDKGKLILSRKIIMEAEESKKKEEVLASLQPGSTIRGTVKRLTNFGAFVDVGGIDGLIHISELAWERVDSPGEVLNVGDEIDVKVLEVSPEKERISLSLRKTQPDPWTKAIAELESGELIKGKVTRLVNFGAFVELKPGVEGLAHISQLADYHVKHPSEVLEEGEEVEVKILEIKPKAKRISLSLKEARGVMLSPEKAVALNTDDGNVTLGDLFGDLFDKPEEPADSAEAAGAAEESNNDEESAQ